MSFLNASIRKLTGKSAWFRSESVNGIQSLLDVPKGTAYNIVFFTDAVMPSFIENVRSGSRRKALKGW
jgi:hypothetical protein